ncbi:hypothetical protein ONE63_000323 [Megalurothrips usitatus]|uniref:Tudor domain-containing protein n=1 Tax=Megalurothrips usitatus TaxID=439358 RepID=A0AAV7Y4V9_9NEOP|nr:hypothetical protein ONE63_000323 [Megalurothrips usitatus]
MVQQVDLEELKVNFNAILTSGGGRLSERQFISDYRSLIGGFVPYEKLGHRNLRSLIESLGGFFYTRDAQGDVINAGYNEKTAHISKLIAGQKKKPGAKSKKRSSYSRPHLPQRLTQLRRPTPTYNDPVRPMRSAPQPRYGNPPVVPQRQPLGNPPIVPQRQPLGNPPIVPQRQPLGNPQIVPQRQPLGNPPIIPQRQALGNPPIIPQRQRLDMPEPVPPKKLTSIQDRLNVEARTGPSLDLADANKKIMSANLDDSQKTSNPKESHNPTNESEDASYIDIQWLRGKVHSNGKVGKEIPSQKRSLDNSTSPTLQSNVQGSLVQQTSPQPVPLMSLSVSPPVHPPVVQPSKLARVHPSDQKVVFKSYADELLSLLEELSLGEPEYRYVERCPSRGKPVYTAKVKIKINDSTSSFTSYPDEKPTREEAQECAAKLAIEDLKTKHVVKHVSRLPRDKAASLRKFEEIKERIYQIIEKKANGMFDEAIAQEYVKEFKTTLPAGWLESLMNSPMFTIEHLKGVNRKAIVYPVARDKIPPTPPVVTPPLPDVPSFVHSVADEKISSVCFTPPVPDLPSPLMRVPSTVQSTVLHDFSGKLCTDVNANTVIADGRKDLRRLPELLIPSEQTWDVFVSSASLDHLFVRLIGKGYDDLYNDVINDLEMNLLSDDGQTALNPVIGEYYAVRFDKCWLRVQLQEINQDTEEAVVFLIDNGDIDKINVTELKVLEDRYLNLPGQAIKCRLSYLDISYEEAQTYLANNIIGSTFVAEVLQHPGPEESCAAVVLHNTEVDGEPINLNNLILDEICKNLHAPQLPQLQPFGNLRISHIAKETPPFVQIQSKALSLLQTVLEDVSRLDLVKQYGVNAHPKLNQVEGRDKHIFLARSRRCPRVWRRGVIINTDNARNPLVNFIDYGYSENVMWSSIFDLALVIPPLTKVPPQAIQVNLYGLSPSQIVPGIVKRLKELAPSDDFIIGKKKDSEAGAGDQLPAVEFFKRVEPDSLMCSINSDLLFKYDE